MGVEQFNANICTYFITRYHHVIRWTVFHLWRLQMTGTHISLVWVNSAGRYRKSRLLKGTTDSFTIINKSRAEIWPWCLGCNYMHAVNITNLFMDNTCYKTLFGKKFMYYSKETLMHSLLYNFFLWNYSSQTS